MRADVTGLPDPDYLPQLMHGILDLRHLLVSGIQTRIVPIHADGQEYFVRSESQPEPPLHSRNDATEIICRHQDHLGASVRLITDGDQDSVRPIPSKSVQSSCDLKRMR